MKYGAVSNTSNHDGANKHSTVMEADAFIGSYSRRGARATTGTGGTVGGGSTISTSTPPGALSVARGKQLTKENCQRPAKLPKA